MDSSSHPCTIRTALHPIRIFQFIWTIGRRKKTTWTSTLPPLPLLMSKPHQNRKTCRNLNRSPHRHRVTNEQNFCDGDNRGGHHHHQGVHKKQIPSTAAITTAAAGVSRAAASTTCPQEVWEASEVLRRRRTEVMQSTTPPFNRPEGERRTFDRFVHRKSRQQATKTTTRTTTTPTTTHPISTRATTKT